MGEATTMATILTFTLAKRRDPQYRPKSGQTGTVVPFPGVRYERLEGDRSARSVNGGHAAVSPNGKALYKPDF